MVKRMVSLITVVALLLSSWSCVSFHKTVAEQPDDLTGRFQVKALLTRSGKRIEFASPATASRDSKRDEIVFRRAEASFVTAESELVEWTEAGRDRLYDMRFKDGVRCTGYFRDKSAGKVTVDTRSLVVPVSQVETAWVQRTRAGLTFAVNAGIAVGVIGIFLATKESCPFVYSYDGNEYTLDGEPYGGATAPGLKRTDWGLLKHVKPVDGFYRFKLTNEVQETQYTDELKLVVVDHPADVSVVADEYGALHTVRSPSPPVSALDARGRDILPFVNEDDWVYWQSAEGDLDPLLPNGAKHKLTFRFPKPPGAKRLKLVFDGGNTLWASQMVKRFLEMNGTGLADYYASLDKPGPALFALQSWNMREELYRLQVRFHTPSGVVIKGSVAGGGPFVTRAKLYLFDISDLPGDTLTMELTPPVGFWAINHIAVDYSDDVPVRSREIGAARAVDSHGTDLTTLLSAADKRYAAMPLTGDSADLAFQVPPPGAAGTVRSVILKTNGYYDIHMGTPGEPQREAIARVMNETGFAVRYSMQEFARWRAELAGAAAK